MASRIQGNLKIYCIGCQSKIETSIDEIEKGQLIICSYCERKFNVFGVYDHLYQSIPFAKRVVDTLASKVCGRFSVENQKGATEQVEEFLESSGFQDLFEQIVFDTVLFGNSFLEKLTSDKMTRFERVDPTTVTIVTEFRQTSPFTAYYEEIQRLIQHIGVPKKLEILKNDFVHFVGEPDIGHHCIGLSVFGYWFHSWTNVLFSPTNMLKNESKILIAHAARVPIFAVEPEIQLPETEKERRAYSFQMDINRRRKRISRVIEEEIFPLATGSCKGSPKIFWD